MPDSEAPPAIDHEQLRRLATGARLAFENAEALYNEGKLLGKHRHTARALFLHQISLEECAKIENLGAWATSLLAGHRVDAQKVLAALNSHAKKNRTNAYFLDVSKEEREAREHGDWKLAGQLFKQRQAEFHGRSNSAKNAALYVDFDNGDFVAPATRISAEMLAEFVERNEQFLAMANTKVEMLERWIDKPEVAQSMTLALMEVIEGNKASGLDGIMAAIDALIDGWIEDVRKRKPGANRAIRSSRRTVAGIATARTVGTLSPSSSTTSKRLRT